MLEWVWYWLLPAVKNSKKPMLQLILICPIFSHSFILGWFPPPPPLKKLFPPLLSSPFKKIKIGSPPPPPLTDKKTEKCSSHMKHTHLGIYQIYSEACWPAEKMSEENGVSYTDIDQLIRKKTKCCRKIFLPPPPFKIVHFHVPPLIFRKFTSPPLNKIFGNFIPPPPPPPPPLQKGGEWNYVLPLQKFAHIVTFCSSFSFQLVIDLFQNFSHSNFDKVFAKSQISTFLNPCLN